MWLVWDCALHIFIFLRKETEWLLTFLLRVELLTILYRLDYFLRVLCLPVVKKNDLRLAKLRYLFARHAPNYTVSSFFYSFNIIYNKLTFNMAMKSNESHPEKKQEATAMIIITAIIGIINVMFLAGCWCTPKMVTCARGCIYLNFLLLYRLASTSHGKCNFLSCFFFSRFRNLSHLM